MKLFARLRGKTYKKGPSLLSNDYEAMRLKSNKKNNTRSQKRGKANRGPNGNYHELLNNKSGKPAPYSGPVVSMPTSKALKRKHENTLKGPGAANYKAPANNKK